MDFKHIDILKYKFLTCNVTGNKLQVPKIVK